MSSVVKLSKPKDEDVVPTSTFDYPSAVGGLLYLSITARPDIAQAVGVLSRFMSCPGKDHVEAAQRTIRYLFATKDMGITFSQDGSASPHLSSSDPSSLPQLYIHTRKTSAAVDNADGDVEILFKAYADADLAGDESTRKSTSGYCMMYHGGAICWLSKLQSTIALSTAEAETIAGVEAVKQIMHLRLFLNELGLLQHGPTVVYEDNNAAIAMAKNEEQSKRSKHYQLKVRFLQDQFQRGIFSYSKVDTKEQLADAFTKALPWTEFVRCRDWMGVSSPPV
jgi:hypothetical protein